MLIILLLSALAGCSGSQVQAAPSAISTPTQAASPQVTPIPAATVAGSMTTEELEAAGAGADSAEDAMAENSKAHEDAADYTWDESEVIQQRPRLYQQSGEGGDHPGEGKRQCSQRRVDLCICRCQGR